MYCRVCCLLQARYSATNVCVFSSQLLRNLKSWPIDSIFHQFLMQQCTNPISTKFTRSEVKKKSWLTYVGFLESTSFLVFCFYWSSSFQCYDWLFDCMPDQTNIECINTASSKKLNQAKYYSYYYRKLHLFLNVLHCSNLKSCYFGVAFVYLKHISPFALAFPLLTLNR